MLAASLVLVALGLVALALFVRAAEASLTFYPLRGEDDTPATFGLAYETLELTTTDAERLRAWWMPNPSARATVVYFHGNGGNLSMWAPILANLWRRAGVAVLAVDYRGYGLSSGRPSEAGLYRDVDAAIAALDARPDRPSAPVIYWGRSLGGVMAAYAATKRAPDGLILESGFPSVRAVVEGSPLFWLLSWLSSYRFPAAEWLAQVSCPTLVLHGDRDSVIPFRLGQRLYDAVRGPKRFVVIPGGDHNDLEPPDPERYWQAVTEFVRGLTP
jgi:hypothetical protein